MKIWALLAAAALAVAPSAAHADWYSAETDHFLVYSDSDAQETEEFARKLERFARAMRFMQNMPPSPPQAANRLTIYRWGDVRDVAALYGNSASGVAGFFVPRASGSVAFVPARETRSKTPGTRVDTDELDAQTILFHEYAHHFMFQHFSAAYPAWYVEGFAEVYATADFLDDGVYRIGDPATHRGLAFVYDTPFPPEKLFEAKQKPEDSRHYYSVGWLLTHYLTFSPDRAGQLKKYLTAVNRGIPSKDAAKASFGDLGKLNRDLKAYQGSRLRGLEVKPNNFVPPQVRLRRLGEAEEAMILTKMRSDRGVNKKTAPQVAAQARDRARAYPASVFVQTALSEAEFDARNLDAAEAAADRALKVDPSAVEALIYKGLVYLKRAEKDPSLYPTAREWFVKANRASPNDPEPLIYNYLTFAKAGGDIPELAIIGLERAFELAPFDIGVRFLLARQLLRESKAKSARTVLSPIAFSPHGGKIKDAADEIIASVERNDLQQALALADTQIKKFDSDADDEDDDKKPGRNR